MPALLAALFNAGTFGVFTFLGLLGVDEGIPDALVPLVLARFGIGSFLGVTSTGRWASGREQLWIGIGGALASVGWMLMALSPVLPCCFSHCRSSSALCLSPSAPHSSRAS